MSDSVGCAPGFRSVLFRALLAIRLHFVGGLVAAPAVLAALLVTTTPVAARDFVGFDYGLSQPMGQASDFATSGLNGELRWRHENRGRSAWELAFGYFEWGIEGEVQNTIDHFEALIRRKNQEAQQQGHPNGGSLEAEHGVFEAVYFGANFLFYPIRVGRLAPLLSMGVTGYNWRLPFRLKFRRVPMFGEQQSYDPLPENVIYQSVHPEQELDFTKHNTSGGLNMALGATFQLMRRVTLGAQARFHVMFSSGAGNREEGIDDQDYLDAMTFVLLQGGLNYRF